MNRYGTLGPGPVDRDQERLLRELHVEQAPEDVPAPAPARRPGLALRVRRALGSLLQTRPSSALR